MSYTNTNFLYSPLSPGEMKGVRTFINLLRFSFIFNIFVLFSIFFFIALGSNPLLTFAIIILVFTPSILLLHSINRIEKNKKEFPYLQWSVRLAKLLLVLLTLLFSVQFYLFTKFIHENIFSGAGTVDSSWPVVMASLLVLSWLAIDFLFYKPLSRHRLWITHNGIFASQALEGNPPAPSQEELTSNLPVEEQIAKWKALLENKHISTREFKKIKGELLKNSPQTN